METTLNAARLLVSLPMHYATRLARGADEVRAAQRLRFHVFNEELHEGLESSLATGLDEDQFDPFCDHLVVEHRPTQQVVGTYRLQTGPGAAAHSGYYSEQEFECDALESLRPSLIELGRACVHPQHRNLVVLGLLWKGIADYAQQRGGRYLFGCSSLTSQDPTVGASAYADLFRRHLAPPEFRVRPRPAFECPLYQLHPEPVKLPKLLRAYLTIGAKICGPPALDRQFKTIDFLTLLDVEALPILAKSRFLTT